METVLQLNLERLQEQFLIIKNIRKEIDDLYDYNMERNHQGYNDDDLYAKMDDAKQTLHLLKLGVLHSL